MTAEPGRRTNRSIPVNLPDEFVQTGGSKGSSEIVQLSAGGCVLRDTGLDLNGQDVFLHFRLGPENSEIHLRARVIHVNADSGTGLEFILVSPEARDLLRHYVAEKVLESAESPQRSG